MEDRPLFVDSLPLGDDTLMWWLNQAGVSPARLATCRPEFLVVSPPKTGSTWLAENFRRHPGLFVPSIKEVKYFDRFFHTLDLNWYLDQLAPGIGRIKGEASPSYALLPVERIRLLRRLAPDVKIVFLMRDPIARAWSHAKHNFRYCEANFAFYAAEFAGVNERDWLTNFTLDWSLANGDYLGQLRRWLSVFPREQVYVGFFETIATDPERLLRELFAFLGVRADIDLSAFPTRERVLAGLEAELPPRLRDSLHRLLHSCTAQLAQFLSEQFGLVPPDAWRDTLAPPAGATGPVPEAFTREADDAFLGRALAYEARFPSGWSPVLGEYRGYNLVCHRGELFALDVKLGDIQPRDLDPTELHRLQNGRQCFVAPTLAALKAEVDWHNHARVCAGLEEVPALREELRDARGRITRLEEELHAAAATLRAVAVGMRTLRPWIWLANRALRPLWRRAKAVVTAFGPRRGRGEPATVPAPLRASRA
jgi:hypothetical protein